MVGGARPEEIAVRDEAQDGKVFDGDRGHWRREGV